MYLPRAVTPCPATFCNPSQHYTAHADTVIPTAFISRQEPYDGDDTANIEYTTTSRAQIWDEKPRRPPHERRKRTWDPSRDIYDENKHAKPPDPRHKSDKLQKTTNSQMARRSSVLARPHERENVHHSDYPEHNSRESIRRHVSSFLADENMTQKEYTSAARQGGSQLAGQSEYQPKKRSRRHTIYIPSEDTTIMTIHPGAASYNNRRRPLSPDIGLELVTLSEEDETSKHGEEIRRQGRSRKSLAAAPKRAPLHRNSRPLQSVIASNDVVGRGGGKENMPPGKMRAIDLPKLREDSTFDRASDRMQVAVRKPPRKSIINSRRADNEDHSRVKQRLAKTTAHFWDIQEITPNRPNRAEKRVAASPKAQKYPANISTKAAIREQPTTALHVSSPRRASDIQKKQIGISFSSPSPVAQQGKQLVKYPVIIDDLAQPELYEDHWLKHQEIALTQLINTFFENANETQPTSGGTSADLRKRLLSIYHKPDVPLLYKRLQASLMYGALSISKDALAQALRLKDDVGLRRKYLNLWLDTYDLNALRAAAEVIVGREIRFSAVSSGDSVGASDQERKTNNGERKTIEVYLDTFFIRHEDAVHTRPAAGSIKSIARGCSLEGDRHGSQERMWCRIVLRSLMLVLLLDRAKSSNAFRGNLFQCLSPHKSSLAVTRALGGLLLPSLGDMTRPLSHLEYTVTVTQIPIQERTMRIDNIATELRDGVLLTRLVELLLYPPTSDSTTAGKVSDCVFGIHRATNSGRNDSPFPSQHLKYPCPSRVQKLHNVRVALNALYGTNSMTPSIGTTIRAEDVVDGHREKTLSLLWSIVSDRGLDMLVDWKLTTDEVARLQVEWTKRQYNEVKTIQGSSTETQPERDVGDPAACTLSNAGIARSAELLLSWARSIARLHGLHSVVNFTTSFADGRVVAAIVDEYAEYLSAVTTADIGQTTDARLKLLGCSHAFVALLAPATSKRVQINHHSTTHSIPSQTQTITTLLFLASRLLPLAATSHAATVIQRAYRSRLVRREVTRRVVLMRLAVHCSTVVQARERIVGAAVRVQRAWRRHIKHRVAELARRVVVMQSLWRGRAVRMELFRERQGKQTRRVGW